MSKVTALWIGDCLINEEIISNEFSDRKLDILRELVTKIIDCELKARIVERIGGNIRNEVCHGLYSYEKFFDARTIYMWWLTLFLCLVPSRKNWLQENNKH